MAANTHCSWSWSCAQLEALYELKVPPGVDEAGDWGDTWQLTLGATTRSVRASMNRTALSLMQNWLRPAQSIESRAWLSTSHTGCEQLTLKRRVAPCRAELCRSALLRLARLTNSHCVNERGGPCVVSLLSDTLCVLLNTFLCFYSLLSTFIIPYLLFTCKNIKRRKNIKRPRAATAKVLKMFRNI